MPARSEWKGFLEINQLQVPVKAFSAASSEPEISLNQLHQGCGERIRQQRFCPVHGPVQSEAIIHGYQVSDGCYLPLESNDIDQLKPDSDKAIAVECFLDSQTIDPVFHTGRTLYLVPDGPPGQRPFNVLREGMKLTGRHAFSRFVISRREQLAVLRPYGRLLAMTFVEYAHRVRASADYESEISSVLPGASELGLIRQLIDVMTNRDFELRKYRDRYMDGLSALIEQRVAAMDLMSATKSPGAHKAEDDDAVMAMLNASLAAAGVGNSVDVVGSKLRSAIDEEELQGQKSA